MPEVVATPDATTLPGAKAVVVGPGSMGTDGWKSAWRHGLTSISGFLVAFFAFVEPLINKKFGPQIESGDFSFLADWHLIVGTLVAGAIAFLGRGGWYAATAQKEVVSNAPPQ